MDNLNFKFDKFNSIVKYRFSQIYRQKLGWQGLIGVALMLGSLIHFYSISNEREIRLKQFQAEINHLKKLPKASANNVSTKEGGDVAKLFYEALPSQTEANNKISTILRVATDNGLVVNKVEYEQPLSETLITQYQIHLPLTGTYTQIRQFIKQLLNTLPSIALQDIKIKRENISTDVVDAQVQLTLFLQKS